MTSVLEICTLHLKPSYAADAVQHEADMKEGMRSTVLKIPGVRWARWATCVEKPNISTVFVDWDRLESHKEWEATPEAQTFVNFWSERTEPPSENPDLPGIYHRNIIAPSDVLEAIFSKPIIETHEFFIPSHLDLETTRKSFTPFNERISSLFVSKGIPWIPRPTVETERNIVTVKGWDSVEHHRETTSPQWVKDGLQKTFGGMERLKSVHWRIQPEE